MGDASTMMGLGGRIRQRREEKRISGAELARKAGVSKGYLSELENGKIVAPRTSGDVLHRIAVALGTTVADLLGREVRPVPHEVPPSLEEFAQSAQLPHEDIEMLAQIKFRGEQPNTADDWRFIYESIRRSIRGGPS